MPLLASVFGTEGQHRDFYHRAMFKTCGLIIVKANESKGGASLATVRDLAGARIIDGGTKVVGETLILPRGKHALWLMEGAAWWQADEKGSMHVESGDTIAIIEGPGRLEFTENSHYAQFEEWDELGFDPRASLYAALMASHNFGIGQALAAPLPLGRGQIWVDVGTGTGAMVQALQGRSKGDAHPWILGVDRAPKMLEQAWADQKSGTAAWFVVRDLSRLAWPSTQFDGTTALLLFHLVDHLEELLANMYRALKPGGILAYAVSADENPFVRMVMRQIKGPGDFFKRGARQVRQSVVNTGFELIRTEVYRDEIAVESAKAMMALIGSIGAPGSRGLRDDVAPPPTIERVFDLVWAQKPEEGAKSDGSRTR